MIRIRRRELLALLLSTTAARSEIIKVSPCTVDNGITPCTGSGGGGPSPTVTSLTPNNGAGGTSVAIVGTNFTGATAVSFGATAATSFTVNSATSITAIAPAGTGVVNVVVTVAGHGSAPGAGNQYTYPASPPTVTALSPNTGPAGTSVAVTGTNFTGATACAFGGVAATSFTVNSAVSITAVAPAGSGTVNVTVTTPAGTSATGAGNQYTYPAAAVTLDPANKSPNITLSNGNLTATGSRAIGNYDTVLSTVSHTSGKYYAEMKLGAQTGNSGDLIGIQTAAGALNNYLGNDAANEAGYQSTGTRTLGGVGAFPGSFTGSPGDTVQMAVDLTAHLMWVRVNGGVWNAGGTANPATGVGGMAITGTNLISGAAVYFAACVGGSDAVTVNFGATPYLSAAPAGFLNWDGSTPSAPAVTFDPAAKGASITLSNGNLTASTTYTPWTVVRATSNHATGKYYAEWTVATTSGGYTAIGVANSNALMMDGDGLDSSTYAISMLFNGAVYYNGGFGANPGTSFGPGDIVQVAVDTSASLIWWRINGAGNWNGAVGGSTANPATGTGGITIPIAGPFYLAIGLDWQSGAAASGTINFGATAYAFTPPTGFGNW